MKVPYMDLTGNVRFPHDKHVSKEELEAYFRPPQEDNDVGDHGHSTDNNDPDSDLEAEQTSDMRELDQRLETVRLWRDLMAAFNRREIPVHIWADEIEDRLAAYDFWKEE
jgi:hypothetical protein